MEMNNEIEQQEKQVNEYYKKELIDFINRMKLVDISKLNTNSVSNIKYQVHVERDVIKTVRGLIRVRTMLNFYRMMDDGIDENELTYLKNGVFEP